MAAQTQAKKPPPKESNGNGDKKAPIHRIYYPVVAGTLCVSVFDKVIQTDSGDRTVYSVATQRSYQKGDDRDWTYYLRDSDLPTAALGLEDAFRWISAYKQSQREGNGGSGEDIPF